MYNEGENKGKHEGKCCEGEAKGEQIRELNDGRLYEVFRWKGEIDQLCTVHRWTV